MSYTLDLYFKPAVRLDRMLQFSAARKHYTVVKDKLSYENPDTGVYFWIKLRCARNILLQRTVASAEFEINYNRPSFFGIEAERELSSFIATFQPRIEDPQMHGMGEGPYSREGFLSGWNFGNVFGVHNRLSGKSAGDIPSLPADTLRAVWAWNDQRADLKLRKAGCVVPMIRFLYLDGRLRRVVIWGEGAAIVLPQVDYVLVGRLAASEKRVALVPWSDVLDVAKRARFDTSKDPLSLAYLVTPKPIAEWLANIPLIDFEALPGDRLEAHQVIDDELIAAARELRTEVIEPTTFEGQ
jgi:hypothetical protein